MLVFDYPIIPLLFAGAALAAWWWLCGPSVEAVSGSEWRVGQAVALIIGGACWFIIVVFLGVTAQTAAYCSSSATACSGSNGDAWMLVFFGGIIAAPCFLLVGVATMAGIAHRVARHVTKLKPAGR